MCVCGCNGKFCYCGGKRQREPNWRRTKSLALGQDEGTFVTLIKLYEFSELSRRNTYEYVERK